MTTRPRNNTRPNSAIYLGEGNPFHQGISSTPPNLPDLPEPPDPSSPVSSTGSGLPSPPATNSTGSGSVGDPSSIAIRTRSSAKNMLNASNIKAFHAAFSHDDNPEDDEDDYNDRDYEHGNENEDDTAKLTRRHFPANENALALQRALTLKERTRMTIDKLSSYSRNTPSPSAHARNSHSLPDQTHSGSETEREPIDSIPRPSTPRLSRSRLISAPASPAKALLGLKQTNSTSSNSSGSPSRPRKRVSMAMSDLAELAGGRKMRSPDIYETPHTSRRLPDVAQAALAAVASSRGRMSPTSTKKRQPLPREFFDASSSGSATAVSRRGSMPTKDTEYDDYGYGRLSTEPTTPHHTMPRPSSSMRHLQLSPRQQKNLNSTLTHSSLSDPRSSTLRRHQSGGQWASEDMSVVSSRRTREMDGDREEPSNPRGRKQTLRTGGSADSALTVAAAGRSLVGEGLKAAGLRNGGTVGRSSGDIFDEITPLRDKLVRDKERAQRIERIERSISRAGSRSQSRVGWEDEQDDEDNEGHFSNAQFRTRVNGSDLRARAGTIVGPRASTSMAILDREREGVGGEAEPRTAPPHLRTYQSSLDLPLAQDATYRREVVLDMDFERDREDRAPSSLSRYASSSRRLVSNSTSNSGESSSHHNIPDRSDHNRLLQDSLRMFETHVARAPSTSSATTNDLLRNAQSIASTAEKLNLMTRVSMSKALEAQINAEVDAGAGSSTVDVWRAIGADYRDQMRVSDELVRSVTDFLLGVGRAVKDMTGGDGHGRSVSLDELGGRMARSSIAGSDGGSTGSGRRSTESRKSWGDDVNRLSTGTKRSESALSGERPSSVLNRENPTTSLRTRQSNGNATTTTPGRALMLSRGGRTQDQVMGTFDSQETIQGLYDPSPTPASRMQSNRNPDRGGATNLDRARTLPPLSIPKPLGQLPSETLARRQTQTPARRRPTTSGSTTVRGPFPLTSPNIPTTALTPHTVSNNDRQEFPSLRSGSGLGGKTASTPRSTVTFSRSSTVSALTGLQQQQQLAEQQRQRKRTQSNSSTSGTEAVEQLNRTEGARLTRTTSGSEGERGPMRTVGKQGDRPRMSLDGSGTLNGSVHAADRSAATSFLTSASKPRERRKTVVDVWPKGESERVEMF